MVGKEICEVCIFIVMQGNPYGMVFFAWHCTAIWRLGFIAGKTYFIAIRFELLVCFLYLTFLRMDIVLTYSKARLLRVQCTRSPGYITAIIAVLTTFSSSYVEVDRLRVVHLVSMAVPTKEWLAWCSCGWWRI